jgi:regulator of sirC expression with transglutaminase-like and TPR domain
MAAQAINNHLYSVHGFRGNEQDYYNTDNSCLNKAGLHSGLA